jgi:hypothetical protein
MEDPIAKGAHKVFFLTTGCPKLKIGSQYECVTGKEDISVRTIELLHAVTSCIPRGLIFLSRVHRVEQ